MNEISIIINGTRYDAEGRPENTIPCDGCDFVFKCHEYNFHFTVCLPLLGNRIFKKSDKKFEK